MKRLRTVASVGASSAREPWGTTEASRAKLAPTLIGVILLALASPAWAATVTSCDRQLTIERPPQRAVSHDITLTAMLLDLGLRQRMVGYSGISGWKTVEPAMQAQLDGLPELAARYPSLENLLDADADFFFAGWNYGMRIGGEVTPASLARFGIPVYELSESCAHVIPKRVARLDDDYTDLRNLGRSAAPRGSRCRSRRGSC